MRLRSRVLLIRTQMMLRRENRLRRRRLTAELATYRSAADLADLGAILDSYPYGPTLEIRRILAGQQLRRPT